MGWVRYANLSRNSSVREYYLRTSRIYFRFRGKGRFGGIVSSEYRYSTSSAGSFVFAMKNLAKKGRGLNSFINRFKPRYYDRR